MPLDTLLYNKHIYVTRIHIKKQNTTFPSYSSILTSNIIVLPVFEVYGYGTIQYIFFCDLFPLILDLWDSSMTFHSTLIFIQHFIIWMSYTLFLYSIAIGHFDFGNFKCSCYRYLYQVMLPSQDELGSVSSSCIFWKSLKQTGMNATWSVCASLVAQMIKNQPVMQEIPGFDPWVRNIPWRREWQSTPVFLPGESHVQKSLVSYSPWS